MSQPDTNLQDASEPGKGTTFRVAVPEGREIASWQSKTPAPGSSDLGLR